MPVARLVFRIWSQRTPRCFHLLPFRPAPLTGHPPSQFPGPLPPAFPGLHRQSLPSAVTPPPLPDQPTLLSVVPRPRFRRPALPSAPSSPSPAPRLGHTYNYTDKLILHDLSLTDVPIRRRHHASKTPFHHARPPQRRLRRACVRDRAQSNRALHLPTFQPSASTHRPPPQRTRCVSKRSAVALGRPQNHPHIPDACPRPTILSLSLSLSLRIRSFASPRLVSPSLSPSTHPRASERDRATPSRNHTGTDHLPGPARARAARLYAVGKPRART